MRNTTWTTNFSDAILIVAIFSLIIWSLSITDLAAADEIILSEPCENTNRCAAFSSNGKFFASNDHDRSIFIWDASTWKLRQTLQQVGRVNGFQFVPGRSALISYSSRQVLFWDLEATIPTIPRALVDGAISAISVSSDGQMLAVACHSRISRNQFVEIYSLSNLKTKAIWTDGSLDLPDSLAFSPSGMDLAFSSPYRRDVLIWRVGLDQMYRSFKLPLGHGHAVAFSPDGTLIAAVNGTKDQDGSVVTWDFRHADVRNTLRSGAKSVNAIVFTPDGSNLIGAGTRTAIAEPHGREIGAIVIWSLKANSSRTRSLHDGPVRKIAISPDGQRLATAYSDGKLKIFDVSVLTQVFQDN